MGVFGLTTYYKEKETLISDKFDLVEEAYKRGGLEIVVDYSSFVVLTSGKSRSSLNRGDDVNACDSFHICHAEYDVFKTFVSNVITKLRKCNIELVFFTDGEHGSDKANFAKKFETRKSRHHSGIETVTHVQDYCRGHESSRGVSLVPPLSSTQMWRTLKEFGCKVLHNPGEADVAIAKYLVETEKAFAVLGNDSDFCVMKGCRFIPEDWFDLKKELDSVGDLQDLEVRVITPEKVAAALQLESHEELVELAILKGCDFTKPYMHEYLQAELRRLYMEDLAEWFIENIRPVGSLEGYEPLRNHLESNQELKEAISFARDFYNLVLNEEKPSSSLGLYLDTSVRQSQLPGEVLAWYNGISCTSLLIEDLSLGKPAINPALQGLRKFMYALVKEHGDDEVTEYGRTSTESFHVAKVAKAVVKNWPLADQIQTLSPNTRLHIFDMVASHLEKEVPSKIKKRHLKNSCKYVHPFFETFGIKQAFLYYVINYLLSLSEHKGESLNLSKEELLVVTAMAFHEETEMPIRHENVKPSIRCLTVSSWFQETFRHFVHLARILLVDEEIPEPQNVFIGRHFVACFMEVENAVKQGLRLPTFSDSIVQHYNSIVKSNLVVGKAKRKCLILPMACDKVVSSGSPSAAPAAAASKRAGSSQTNYGKFSMEVDDEDSCRVPQNLQDRVMEEPVVDISESAYEEEVDTPNTADGVLPILAFKDRILNHVKNHRITCIHGETGCGKSTKVPQFILDDYERNPQSYSRKPNIVVTQPRRIAAKSLAERVAAEQKTIVGKKVGYKIGQDYCSDKDTQLLFVTTGYFLQFVVHNPMYFKEFSHVILDEIHERDMDSDLVSLIVKLLAEGNTDTKIIIMSATLQGDMFLRYFASNEELQAMSSRTLFVGAKRFPVEEIYLEDLNRHIGGDLDKSHKVQILEGIKCFNSKKLGAYLGQREKNESATRIRLLIEELQKDGVLQNTHLNSKPSPSWSSVSRRELCAGVIRACAAPGEAILVFLPGEQSIDNLFETLIPFEERLGPGWKCLIRLFVLHSKIPFQEQMDVFSTPAADRAHVILSTNIAESSLTVPNVRVVIDYGQKKQLAYDTKRRVNVLRLNWCSRASLDQRKGRTGRVFAGKCIRLITKQFYTTLPDFDMPQIQVSPLDKLVLRVKYLGQKIAPHCKPSELLSQAIEPPRVENIQEAVQTLADVGAIEHADETATVTLLGSTAMLLPSDLRLCRLVLYGILFCCPCDAIVMAAALQSKDPFSMPTKKIMKDDVKFIKSLSHSTTKRAEFDEDQYSEPIMLRNVFRDWLQYLRQALQKERRNITKTPFSVAYARQRFCHKHALHHSRFLSLESLVRDIAGSANRMIDRDSLARPQVKSLLAALPMHRRGTTCEEPERPYGLSSSEASTLFARNTMMLNFVLAAAFNPAILQGVSFKTGLQRKETDLLKSKTLIKDIKESSMDPKGTICVPNVPETFHYDANQLSDVLKRIAAPEKFKMVSSGRLFIEYKRQDTGNTHNRIINDVPLSAHALCQFGEGRETFPLQLLRPSSSTVDEDGKARVQLRKPIQPYQINWSLMSIGGASLMSGKKSCKPHFEWKNPIAFACETEGVDHYAVGCKFTLSGGGNGWIDGVSVLPSVCDNLISLLLILAFQPKHFEAKFKISSKEKRILSVELFGHECKFSTKHPLTTELLRILNELRQAISGVFGDHVHSPTRGIPDCNLAPLVEKLIKEAKAPSGKPKRNTRTEEVLMPCWLKTKPMECSNRFSTLLLNEESPCDKEQSNAKADEKSKKDVVFTVSAFEPEQEEVNLSDKKEADFVLLKPYNEAVLQDSFIASRVTRPCKESQDAGIKTMIESFPDSDTSDDEAIPVLAMLHLWLERAVAEELFERVPESVSLELLANVPKVHSIVEDYEEHSGTMFIWKDFFVNNSTHFHCISQDSGSFKVGLTPAGIKKFSRNLKTLQDPNDDQQLSFQSGPFDSTYDMTRETAAPAASRPQYSSAESVPAISSSCSTASEVPSWAQEKDFSSSSSTSDGRSCAQVDSSQTAKYKGCPMSPQSTTHNIENGGKPPTKQAEQPQTLCPVHSGDDPCQPLTMITVDTRSPSDTPYETNVEAELPLDAGEPTEGVAHGKHVTGDHEHFPSSPSCSHSGSVNQPENTANGITTTALAVDAIVALGNTQIADIGVQVEAIKREFGDLLPLHNTCTLQASVDDSVDCRNSQAHAAPGITEDKERSGVPGTIDSQLEKRIRSESEEKPHPHAPVRLGDDHLSDTLCQPLAMTTDTKCGTVSVAETPFDPSTQPPKVEAHVKQRKSEHDTLPSSLSSPSHIGLVSQLENTVKEFSKSAAALAVNAEKVAALAGEIIKTFSSAPTGRELDAAPSVKEGSCAAVPLHEATTWEPTSGYHGDQACGDDLIDVKNVSDPSEVNGIANKKQKQKKLTRKEKKLRRASEKQLRLLKQAEPRTVAPISTSTNGTESTSACRWPVATEEHGKDRDVFMLSSWPTPDKGSVRPKKDPDSACELAAPVTAAYPDTKAASSIEELEDKLFDYVSLFLQGKQGPESLHRIAALPQVRKITYTFQASSGSQFKWMAFLKRFSAKVETRIVTQTGDHLISVTGKVEELHDDDSLQLCLGDSGDLYVLVYKASVKRAASAILTDQSSPESTGEPVLTNNSPRPVEVKDDIENGKSAKGHELFCVPCFPDNGCVVMGERLVMFGQWASSPDIRYHDNAVVVPDTKEAYIDSSTGTSASQKQAKRSLLTFVENGKNFAPICEGIQTSSSGQIWDQVGAVPATEETPLVQLPRRKATTPQSSAASAPAKNCSATMQNHTAIVKEIPETSEANQFVSPDFSESSETVTTTQNEGRKSIEELEEELVSQEYLFIVSDTETYIDSSTATDASHEQATASALKATTPQSSAVSAPAKATGTDCSVTKENLVASVEEIPGTSKGNQLVSPLFSKSSETMSTTQNERLKSIEGLEEELVSQVLLLLQKNGPEMLGKIAALPDIQKITQELKAAKGSKFKWMPFLQKFETQIKVTTMGGSHWLAASSVREDLHSHLPPQELGSKEELCAPVCQPSTIVTVGSHLNEEDCPGRTECLPANTGKLASALVVVSDTKKTCTDLSTATDASQEQATMSIHKATPPQSSAVSAPAKATGTDCSGTKENLVATFTVKEIPETLQGIQLVSPSFSKSSETVSTTQNERLKSIEELEEELVSQVLLLLQKKKGPELFGKVAALPHIQRITQELKTATGSNFKWMPLLQKFATQIEITKMGGGHWLSARCEGNNSHSVVPPQELSTNEELCAPVCQPSAIATVGSHLNEEDFPGRTECPPASTGELQSSLVAVSDTKETYIDSSTATDASQEQAAMSILKATTPQSSAVSGPAKATGTECSITMENLVATCIAKEIPEASQKKQLALPDFSSEIMSTTQNERLKSIEGLEEELVSRVLLLLQKKESPEMLMLCKIADLPEIQRITQEFKAVTGSKFKWMPFLQKFETQIKVTTMGGSHWLSASSAREDPHSHLPSQESAPVCQSSTIATVGSHLNEEDCPGRTERPPAGAGELMSSPVGAARGEANPIGEEGQSATLCSWLPSGRESDTQRQFERIPKELPNGYQVLTSFGVYPPFQAVLEHYSEIKTEENGEPCVKLKNLKDPESVSAPSTNLNDTRPDVKETKKGKGNGSELEETMCNLLVRRLQETSNKPILVSVAAVDKELMPLIKQLRALPTGYFRWITFLTERTNIFQINYAQTPNFQFRLKEDKVQKNPSALSKEPDSSQCSESAKPKRGELPQAVYQAGNKDSSPTTDPQSPSTIEAASTPLSREPVQRKPDLEGCSVQQLESALMEFICEFLKVSTGYQLLASVGNQPNINAVTKLLRVKHKLSFNWKIFLSNHSDTFEMKGFDGKGHLRIKLK